VSGPVDRVEQSVSTNGLTKYEGTEPPAPLPGWSAGTLLLRGTIVELLGGSMIVPLVVVAAGHHDMWTGFSYGFLVLAVLGGTAPSIRGFQRGRAEQRAGYATLPKMAQINPALSRQPSPTDRGDWPLLPR